MTYQGLSLDQVRYIATKGNFAGEFTRLECELAQYLLEARQVLKTMVEGFGTPEWSAMILGARDMKEASEVVDYSD